MRRGDTVRSANDTFLLGVSTYDGQDYGEGARLIHHADLGHAQAQYELGLCYALGRGVAKDYSMSAHYSKLAADQGEAAAQCAYAMACLGGLGVPQDHEESVRYYRLAAGQGFA
mmetsp:Transcript_40798/g.96077  ORF Transcript_40798/g.96077 Transcript_40798/m.96077 type:complete len:114 (-) Transcript_40798:739-1080(-)